ncbi:hypothetical protein Scep_020938 [Stephania cephalantha]|uniref:Ubiquitin-like domain-containing protein n=1 Tax=Stephania cephalantha TaxID=152367 RepID=A0AAP0FBR6_9MAGN
MPEEDLVELKFRLYDGTDIGPIRYSSASTVTMLKERIVSDWPKVVPKTASDVKLICAGKILENNKTVGQCKTPFGELPGGVITMHVVVQPSLVKTKAGQDLNCTGCRCIALLRFITVNFCEDPTVPTIFMHRYKFYVWKHGLQETLCLCVDYIFIENHFLLMLWTMVV